MKVRFQYGMPALSGKAGDLTFCLHKSSGRVFARRNRYPHLSDNHHKIGSTTANLHRLKPSVAYKNDLRRYLMEYQRSRFVKRRPAANWVNLFLSLMYEMAQKIPGLDLRTISRTEIYEQNLPCISVMRAVEAGLLPPLGDWESLISEL